MVTSGAAPDAVVRAFSDPKRDASGGRRAVAIDGNNVVLHDGSDRVTLATPNVDGIPYQPTIAGDGSRAAWLRKVADGGHEHIEVTTVHTGFLGSLKRMVGRNYITMSSQLTALDLNHDGTRLACLSPDKVTLYPLERGGAWSHHALPSATPGAVGVQQAAVDVEFMADGNVAVLTDARTAYRFDEKGNVTRLSLPHPEAEDRLSGLDPEERTALLDTYGDALQAAVIGPDARHCVLQVRHGSATRNLILDRQTREIGVIGDGPARPPMWSPDGRFVATAAEDGAMVQPVFGQARPLAADLSGARWADDSRGFIGADGQPIPLSRALTGWEIDLGASTSVPSGNVVQRDDHVTINGIRVQRRVTA